MVIAICDDGHIDVFSFDVVFEMDDDDLDLNSMTNRYQYCIVAVLNLLYILERKKENKNEIILKNAIHPI